MKFYPRFPADYEFLSGKVLEEALHKVPAYRSWRGFDAGPTASINNRFSVLPAISKSDLRRQTWRSFVPSGMNIEKAIRNGIIEIVSTSGTTQEQVTNIWYQPWWNASEAESWHYNIHTKALPLGNHREAILTSPLNTGILSENGLLTMKERTQGRFLYLNEMANPALWDDNIIERIIRELAIFQPVVLEANPSYLAKVSLYAARHDLPVFQPGVIILTYENPGMLARRNIKRAFSAPLVSSYGSTEAGYVLMECEKGKMHQVSSSCRIDLEYLRPEYGQPNTGRMLLTTFGNPWRSLIRFDAGDLVEVEENATCTCGRNDGYIIRNYAGRTVDLTYTTNGHPITTAAIEAAIAGMESITDYQITQQSGCYNVGIVLDDGITASPALQDEITGRLQMIYGNKAVTKVHFPDRIEAEASGKYRRTRSDILLNNDKLFLQGNIQ
ncbi:MAG: hypothetical protein A4E71_00574 [Smithella sp. PtaU1.Bin162]|nr:MAG: hypothetical protein A4E71_00574 [Smithella sp. PtaU1.Bin162]